MKVEVVEVAMGDLPLHSQNQAFPTPLNSPLKNDIVALVTNTPQFSLLL
jgi:hypothetical protein